MTAMGAQGTMIGVILAAGKGTRMKSNLPKVLHPVAGRPMVAHVIDALSLAGIDRACLVLGPHTDPFEELLRSHSGMPVCIQGKQMGTGDAVAAAAAAIKGAKMTDYTSGSLFRGEPQAAEYVLICAGDTPALDPLVLKDLVHQGLTQAVDLSVLAMDVPQPFGYGRIICDDRGQFLRIVEERDASEAQRRITVCNSGVILARVAVLFELLADLEPGNSQGEYYLTDTLGLAVARKGGGTGAKAGIGDDSTRVKVYVTADWQGFSGINDRSQLASVEAAMVEKKIKALMRDGVSFVLPATTYVEMGVRVDPESRIGPHVSLAGVTAVGYGCRIEERVSLRDCTIGDGAVIGSGSVLIGQNIAKGARVAALSKIGG